MLRIVRLLLLLLPLAVSGQDDGENSDFLIRVWQSEDGLPSNVVRSLGQGSDGFLWITTAEGVARFDGIAFEQVGMGPGLPDRSLRLFRIFTPPGGGVWISTFHGGLLQVRDMRLVRVVEDLDDVTPPRINQLIRHADAVFFNRGASHWRIDANGPTRVEEPGTALLEAFAADRENQASGGRTTEASPSPVLIDRRSGTWSSLSRRGLHHASEGADPEPVGLPDSGARIFVNEMLEDHEGNIWLATTVQGLIRLRMRRVQRLVTPQGPYERGLQTAAQTRDGTWWIAKRSGGIDRITSDGTTHLELVSTGYPRPVTALFEDSRGRLWFASRDGTVFEWTGEEFIARFTDTQVPSKVKVVTEDRAGHLWFGGSQGLCRLNGGSVESFQDVAPLQGLDITALIPLPNGSIIAGTIDGRVLRQKNGRFEFLGQPEDLDRRWVSSMMAIGDDEIWATTIGAGLFLWKDGRWIRFDSRNGLPDDRLTAITIHGDDQLWLGSLGGILRVSRSELLHRITNPDIQPSWLRLNRSDGLLTRECLGGGQPSVWTDRDGTIWFPTGRGPVGIRPDRINPHSIAPKVIFRSVKIDGKSCPRGDGPITAGPGRVRLELAFSGLSLGAPEKVVYRCRLSGLNDEFRFIGTQREIGYESISPGHYRFEISATNGDGITSVQPAAVTIIITRHFWQTGWFVTFATLGALLLALAIGWLVARFRMQRRFRELRLHSALESERGRISRDLHDDLGASLTELSILSALGAENPDDSRLRPALQTLSGKAKVVVATLDEIVWAASPRQDSLRSLVDYLCAFTREFLENVDVPLRMDVTRLLPDLSIGPRRRHNVFLATREAINNAVKHAKATELKLRINIEAEQLTIRIRDDGRGFDITEVFSGNGLANIRKRMSDCGGSCDIDSNHGEGTTVTLRLPLPSP